VAKALAGVLAMVVATVGLLSLRALGGSARGSERVRVAPATPVSRLPTSPYDGTPAAGLASGVAGIALPRAAAVPDGHLADYKLNTRAIPLTRWPRRWKGCGVR
jgi:hypothetical protein